MISEGKTGHEEKTDIGDQSQRGSCGNSRVSCCLRKGSSNPEAAAFIADIRRAGTVRFTRIPADGSRKMPDELMDSIEPFDYSELKPFSTAYMPGFMADIYDVDDRESFAYRSTERFMSDVRKRPMCFYRSGC